MERKFGSRLVGAQQTLSEGLGPQLAVLRLTYSLLVGLVPCRATYKVLVTGRWTPRFGPQSLNSPLEGGFRGVIL